MSKLIKISKGKNNPNPVIVVGVKKYNQLKLGVARHAPSFKKSSYTTDGKTFTQQIDMHPYNEAHGIDIAENRAIKKTFASISVKGLSDKEIDLAFNIAAETAINHINKGQWDASYKTLKKR